MWEDTSTQNVQGFLCRTSVSYRGLCPREEAAVESPPLIRNCVQVCLPTQCDPMDYIAHQAPLSMGFFRQEYWSGLSVPPPGVLPNPGIEPESPVSPALEGMFFTTKSEAAAMPTPNQDLSECCACGGLIAFSRKTVFTLSVTE